MAKNDTKALRNNATTANGLATTYGSDAARQQSILTPTLNRLSAGGGGYTAPQMAGMTTAALQATGGATAGTVGGGLQRAAATNNAGGFGAGAIAAAHDSTQNLSDAALGVQNQSAQLAAQQQQGALGELGSLYSTNVGAGENALGLSTQATTQANNAANNGFWHNVAGNLLNPASYTGLVKPR